MVSFFFCLYLSDFSFDSHTLFHLLHFSLILRSTSYILISCPVPPFPFPFLSYSVPLFTLLSHVLFHLFLASHSYLVPLLYSSFMPCSTFIRLSYALFHFSYASCPVPPLALFSHACSTFFIASLSHLVSPCPPLSRPPLFSPPLTSPESLLSASPAERYRCDARLVGVFLSQGCHIFLASSVNIEVFGSFFNLCSSSWVFVGF